MGVGYNILHVVRAMRAVGHFILYVVRAMGTWLLNSPRCEGYRGVGYYFLYVVMAIGKLVIIFFTL